MERAQSTVEHVLLNLALAALLLALAPALADAARGSLDWAAALLPPTPVRHPRTPDERALRSDLIGPLVRAAVPALVLERDRYDTAPSVPVRVGCREPSCARVGRASAALYVHVVRAADGLVVQFWAYHPRSQTSHLPLRALRGEHDDDWEGLQVRLPAGAVGGAARGSAHAGWQGARPWWEQAADDGAPYGGVAYVAAGSHAMALRRDEIDLAGDRWNGDAAVISPGSIALLPADRLGRRPPRFSPATTPPWRKAAWRRPGSRHTGRGDPARRSSRLAAAARAWARAHVAAGFRPRDGPG